jgi:hypothetical protein
MFVLSHTRIHTRNLPLEVWSISPPGGATRYSEKIDELTDPPYSSVQQRDFFLSAHIGKLKHGKMKNSNPTTPDLVQSLNELNRTSTTILPPIANARRNESYNKASASVPAHRRSLLLPLHTNIPRLFTLAFSINLIIFSPPFLLSLPTACYICIGLHSLTLAPHSDSTRLISKACPETFFEQQRQFSTPTFLIKTPNEAR